MAWRQGYNDYGYFPPSRPREAKGGIKAQSKRGVFGESWWAKRWITVLESFHIGARLDRGRSYARRGQVLSITIDKGTVKAKVQGSQPSPYRVTIKLKVMSTAEWRRLAAVLSQQALFTAKLLAGEMPQDIERAFTETGVSLFPAALGDLETECSCPDWSNPCEHIAAVYYLLGEEFDRNPFLLFTLRGMKREEFVTLLFQAEDHQPQATTVADTSQPVTARPKPVKTRRGAGMPNPHSAIPNPQSQMPEPLGAEVADFWGGGSFPDERFGEVQVPAVSAALVKRLGNFPFWRGEERFLSALEPLYALASPRGLDTFLGEATHKETT